MVAGIFLTLQAPEPVKETERYLYKPVNEFVKVIVSTRKWVCYSHMMS